MVMTASRFSARRGLGPLRPRRRYSFRRGQAGGPHASPLNALAAAKQHRPAIG